MFKWLLAPVVFVVLAVSSQAQPWRMQWQAGKTISYRLSHDTLASETIEGKTAETTAKVRNVKQWKVLSVDGDSAVVELSLRCLRLETTTPNGETLVFDSEKPDQSSPQLREQLAKYVGTPLAVLRVNGRGQVVEVKQCNHGAASRYQAELPFGVELPEKAQTAGGTWKRSYRITMEPPHGTGETYGAEQSYSCKETDGETAILTVGTTVTDLPEAITDRIPLMQWQPESEITFSVREGLVRQVRSVIDKEVKDHAGEGSSYRLRSTLVEELVP